MKIFDFQGMTLAYRWAPTLYSSRKISNCLNLTTCCLDEFLKFSERATSWSPKRLSLECFVLLVQAKRTKRMKE